MDILRVLSSPDPEVRKKTLQLVLDLVTSRNIHEVEKIEACGSKISLVFFLSNTLDGISVLSCL